GDQTEEGDHVVQGEEVNIVDDEDVQATVADKPKRIRKKRKAASGAGGSNLPPKKLREDHSTSVIPVLVPLGNPLPPFRIYLIREGGGHTDSVSRPNLRTQHQAERFVISSDSSHHSSTNVSDDEATSIVRSSIPPPSVMTVAVAAIAVAGTYSVLVPGVGTGPAIRSLFANSASPSAAGPDSFPNFEAWIMNRKGRNLRGSVATIETAEVAQVNELDDLKARHLALVGEKGILEGQVTTLESAASAKEAECASLTAQTSKLTQDLSSLQLYFDELNVKVVSLESQKDNLADQVSSLETICSELRDQISDYELFKEQYEVVQDEQVKVLSDRVAGLDADLMGMQIGLAAGINHGRAGRSLTEVSAYDTSVEGKYISAVLALRNLEFNLLPQLELQKDASIADITKDNAVIEETSLYDSLDAVHACVQKINEGTSSCRLYISDVMGPLVEPLSSDNLVGEASTSGVPITVAVTTALSTTFAQIGSVPPISVLDYDAEPHAEAPPPTTIVFEKEELETTLRTFQFRGRSFPLRFLSLYAPLPSASTTSYGPSHLGLSFLPSFAWLASLFRYTRSPGLKLVLRTLEL
ncbi:hypothetical protein Tco_1485370, partial [Tanacetum coccineum]